MSVLVPCRNEGAFIASCLTSIVENGYAEDKLDVLVIDGMSSDGTRDLVQRFAQRHSCVRLLDNPRHTTPVALNIGVRAAQGAFVLWMSAHNRYEKGYIAESLRWALATGADNVGGAIVTVPRTTGVLADAITAVLTHRFGVGGSAFRVPSIKPRWADTVFGGCYRREVFDRIGLFNEALTRGQDIELNLRLARAGGRTLLVPTIRSTYYARTRPLEFIRHTWTNGVWAILPFRYSRIVPVSLRHLVPMGLVAFVLGTLALTAVLPGVRWVPLAVAGSYAIAAGAASLDLAIRRRDLRLLPLLPLAFAALHLSYGLGSLWGAVRSAWPLLRRAVGLSRAPALAQGSRPDGARP